MSVDEDIAAARKSIYRDGYDMSFGEISSLYERAELVIQPEYQRLFRWDSSRKTKFIESVLLNIPIPPIFVFADSGGRWELIDGLQRISTILQFMGILLGPDGERMPSFVCDGTGLLPSLEGVHWPVNGEGDALALSPTMQLGIRRARLRVEILGQQTDSHVRYELFQRLNTGGANLSEQEIRYCIVISINPAAFRRIGEMSRNPDFLRLCRIGEERVKRQYLAELVTRFLVLRHFTYKNGTDIHEYLDKGIISISEDSSFDWDREETLFSRTMRKLFECVGEGAFLKNERFSLAMFEFVSLGLSKALEKGLEIDAPDLKDKVSKAAHLPEAEKYSGMGVRGTQRLAGFVMPLAEKHFAS